MAHENSITVAVPEGFVNLHTADRTADEAVAEFKRTGRSLGNKVFKSRAAALRAAEARSRNTRAPRRNPFRR